MNRDHEFIGQNLSRFFDLELIRSARLRPRLLMSEIELRSELTTVRIRCYGVRRLYKQIVDQVESRATSS